MLRSGDLDQLRGDQVGSLLRPASLKDAWARHAAKIERVREGADQVWR